MSCWHTHLLPVNIILRGQVACTSCKVWGPGSDVPGMTKGLLMRVDGVLVGSQEPWVRYEPEYMASHGSGSVSPSGRTDSLLTSGILAWRTRDPLQSFERGGSGLPCYSSRERVRAIVWVCLCIRPFFIWLCFSLRTQAHTCVWALVFMHIFFLYSSLTSILIC